jgi:hypothetical protein
VKTSEGTIIGKSVKRIGKITTFRGFRIEAS